MSRTVRLALTASIFLLALAGCQQQSSPTASPGTQASTTSKQDEVPATSSSALSVEPATLTTCGNDVVTTVRWNAQAVHAATTATQIWVGPNATDLKLFSEGGAQGEIQTGPWTGPSTHFVLKNKDDGKVLADTTVGGPKCP